MDERDKPNPGLIGPHRGYRELKSCQNAEIVYGATVGLWLREAWVRVLFLTAAVCLCVGGSAAAEQNPSRDRIVPVRGLHLSAPAKKDLATALEFIRESLPKESVNTLERCV